MRESGAQIACRWGWGGDFCKGCSDNIDNTVFVAKQSGIYFMIISVIMLPIAYFTNWMKHTVLGVLSYVAIFVAIFVVVWLSQYLLWKRKIKQMNTLVSKDQ